jgi:hypothetical protein
VSTWLSDAEVADATRRRQPAAQARFLDRSGVPYRRRPDGTLLVSRAALDATLAGGRTIAPGRPTTPANGLNF